MGEGGRDEQRPPSVQEMPSVTSRRRRDYSVDTPVDAKNGPQSDEASENDPEAIDIIAGVSAIEELIQSLYDGIVDETAAYDMFGLHRAIDGLQQFKKDYGQTKYSSAESKARLTRVSDGG